MGGGPMSLSVGILRSVLVGPTGLTSLAMGVPDKEDRRYRPDGAVSYVATAITEIVACRIVPTTITGQSQLRCRGKPAIAARSHNAAKESRGWLEVSSQNTSTGSAPSGSPGTLPDFIPELINDACRPPLCQVQGFQSSTTALYRGKEPDREVRFFTAVKNADAKARRCRLAHPEAHSNLLRRGSREAPWQASSAQLRNVGVLA